MIDILILWDCHQLFSKSSWSLFYDVLTFFIRNVILYTLASYCKASWTRDSLTTKYKDLKANNLLLSFENSSIIDNYVHQLKESSSLYKKVDERSIYQLATNFDDLRKDVDLLKISDFDAIVFGNVSTPHYHNIQLEQFCAPKILLKAN